MDASFLQQQLDEVLEGTVSAIQSLIGHAQQVLDNIDEELELWTDERSSSVSPAGDNQKGGKDRETNIHLSYSIKNK